jgi:hypothetical protein
MRSYSARNEFSLGDPPGYLRAMGTERIARAFMGIGIAWALLVPYGFYVAATSHAGTGMDGVGAFPLRAAVATSAFVLARSVRRGAPFAPPATAAVVYAVGAFLGVVYGVGKAASPHSSLGFMHFGGEQTVGASITFPEMYWARYADSPGPAQGFALLAGIALVVVNAIMAIRVRNATR